MAMALQYPKKQYGNSATGLNEINTTEIEIIPNYFKQPPRSKTPEQLAKEAANREIKESVNALRRQKGRGRRKTRKTRKHKTRRSRK